MSFFFRLETSFFSRLSRLCYWHTVSRKRTRWALKEYLKSKSRVFKFKKLSKEQREQVRSYWDNWYKNLNMSFLDFYNTVTDNFDVRYIPDDLFYSKIDPFFNNYYASINIDDKNLYDLLFSGVKMPITVVRKISGIYMDGDYNIITREQAFKICNSKNKNLIVKPSVESEGGHGINFYDANEDMSCLNEYFSSNNNFIVQEVLSQHESLSYLHKNSLNTIRIMTLIFKDKVYVLSSVVRMGAGGSRVDNLSSGGFACGIQEDGTLKNVAYNVLGQKIMQHPQGAIFKNHKIFNFNECKKLVIRLAPRMAHLSKMVSWDFSIDTDGNPVLIEANFAFGGVGFHQMCNGPIFGNLTADILDCVFSKK